MALPEGKREKEQIKEDEGDCVKEEMFVIGFRMAAGKTAYITAIKNGNKYVFNTTIKKEALRFTKEDAERIIKTEVGDGAMMIQVSD